MVYFLKGDEKKKNTNYYYPADMQKGFHKQFASNGEKLKTKLN